MSDIPYHPPVKRSVTIEGHRTSVSLEPVFWDMLAAAAAERGQPISALVAEIDAERIASATPPGLAGALRIWLLARVKDRVPTVQADDESGSAGGLSRTR